MCKELLCERAYYLTKEKDLVLCEVTGKQCAFQKKESEEGISINTNTAVFCNLPDEENS